MAATVAAIVAGVATAAGAGLSAAGQAKGKKTKTTSTKMPELTPQGQVLQEILLRALLQRASQPPQTMQQFAQEGPRASMPNALAGLTPNEQTLMGLPGIATPATQPNVSPWLLQALQKMGVIQGAQPTAPASASPAAPKGMK